MEKIPIKSIPRKVLIVKPSSLGDVVHSLPFLSALHECFPFAEIDWVIAKGIEGILEGNPLVSKLWVIDKDKWKKVGRIPGTISELGRLARALKTEQYDIVIDLQGLLRSGLITKATRAPVRIGFAEAREGSSLFYTHRVKGGGDLHAVDRYLKVVSALGFDERDVRFPMPLVRESERIEQFKGKIGDYAVIVAGARWNTKRWPAEQFARLAASLDMTSVVVGGAADRDLSKAIEKQSKGKAISMAGETGIDDLIWLIRGARLMISNDSGPMHIAAACGIPVVAIFGPTNPGRTGPYGPNNIVLKSGAGCAPCYKRTCKDMKCMREISPERVLEAVRDTAHIKR
ncbi:MAG TPA: lipopolysaccharide heptosyltransferase I [Dissulfurispiraceae bacterium]|nr:lipopolysaccharide heptosyltransferase I [Dissulfurispiraceae bacterium]